jgi:hypothetical protein
MLAVGLVAAPLLAGCKQGVGERCQVQSDCNDGLLCVLPAGATPQSGGTCQESQGATLDMATPVETDASVPPDLSQVDL